ncbi:hypothetical protein A1O1_06905 [Capronia coronata CBS 617.96]|uniref:Uncharacterized protein n=1 Tax=Capronia coronata CBS 617.96 TaxID=1182541 RepID=W9Y217_9EURO|nr:uncharacterized protein A1O1_06905 [Capronia coronata CBS 617.96]EXJ83286.1 hypothetical protein A1O1_06905 [Capronia coronata CBS 617.96]
MASKSPVLGFLLLVKLPSVLSLPLSQIGAPDLGTLSFAELAQETFRRILELGFLRGILVALFVLGCLVCLLICLLSGLAAYLGRHDTHVCDDKSETSRQNSEHEKVQLYCLDANKRDKQMATKSEGITVVEEEIHFLQQPQPRSRISQLILGRQLSPMTQLQIHTSSPSPIMETELSSSPSISPSPSPSRNDRTTSSLQPRSVPLRSALSKSPPPPHRFSRAQIFLFGRRRSSPSSSPKSVRWADELQLSLTASLELDIRPLDSDFEADIGLGRAEPADDLDLPSAPTSITAAGADVVQESLLALAS